MTKLELKENAELSAAVPVADLPPDYIDTSITDPRDRSLLEVFYRACNSEGGSADEVILRGLKAALIWWLSADHPPIPTTTPPLTTTSTGDQP